jgi:RHS repeat-associated protein
LAVDCSYDALGNRLVSGDRLFIPDHADPLKRPLIEAEAATGEPVRYYLWAPGRLLGFIERASGALTVAHCDEYGSVVALTDASGNTLHTACYGPNGQDWGTTGTNPPPFAWLGGHGVQRVDVSARLGPLYLTRYRLYSASLQRFLSPDPLGLFGGLNLYAYADGDPLSYIDPLGLCAEGSYWETGSYIGDVRQFVAGYGDALIGVAVGLNQMGEWLMNAAAYPSLNIAQDLWKGVRAIPGNIAATWQSGMRSQGQIIGSALITAGTIAAPHAQAGGITKAATGTTRSTAISPYRYTQAGETFQHYSSVQHAESLATGLRPGSYSTTARVLSGVEAQRGLALPQVNPPNAVYTVSPPAGTPIRVNPITRPQFGQPGGLPEVEFILGSPQGSVSGPTLIPRGFP